MTYRASPNGMRGLHSCALLARGLLCLLMATVAVSTSSGCVSGHAGSSLSGPEGTAVSFVRAMYEELDARKAASMACPGSPLQDPWQTTALGELAEVRDIALAASGKPKEMASVYMRMYPVTPADKANGISERKAVPVQFIVRYKGKAQWQDYSCVVVLEKRGANWCVEMAF